MIKKRELKIFESKISFTQSMSISLSWMQNTTHKVHEKWIKKYSNSCHYPDLKSSKIMDVMKSNHKKEGIKNKMK